MPNANQTFDVVIMANGTFPSHNIPVSILRNTKHLIACDGAANTLIAKNIIPEAIVGDCDSLDLSLKTKYKDIIYENPDQETNDLSKAVNFCKSKSFKKITILGATGNRDDHMIANISLLELYSQDMEVIMISDFGCFNAIHSKSTFESFKGQQVSIFSLDQTPLSCENLLYPIKDRIFTRWWQATLNECIADSFIVQPTGATIIYRVFKTTSN